MAVSNQKKSLLLHTCCATCSGFLANKFVQDYDVTVFYYNPNIDTAHEYALRRDEAKRFFANHGIEFVEADYDHQKWLQLTAGLEREPERGKRCKICYHDRLERTAQYAASHGFDCFATTLSISPHKDAKIINNLGRALAVKHRIGFLAGDWKKNDGFKQAMALSHDHNFYRQNYCGCEFSKLVKKG